MPRHKYPWAKSMVDTLVQAAADAPPVYFSETEQRVLGEWVSITKRAARAGGLSRFSRERARARYEATSFRGEGFSAAKADLAMNKGAPSQLCGLDNVCAKQAFAQVAQGPRAALFTPLAGILSRFFTAQCTVPGKCTP